MPMIDGPCRHCGKLWGEHWAPVAFCELNSPHPTQFEMELDDIRRLERDVINTAIDRRRVERSLFPLGAPDSGDGLLNQRFIAEQQAVDALLTARAGKETG